MEQIMNTANYDYVYLSRSSRAVYVDVWNTNIGIVKYKGSMYFLSAMSLGVRGEKLSRKTTGRLSSQWIYDSVGKEVVRKQFGFIPRPGTAWLVNTTTLKRKRIDKGMALIDPDTGRIVG